MSAGREACWLCYTAREMLMSLNAANFRLFRKLFAENPARSSCRSATTCYVNIRVTGQRSNHCCAAPRPVPGTAAKRLPCPPFETGSRYGSLPEEPHDPCRTTALLADVEAFCKELRPIEELCYVEHRFNDQLVPLAQKHNILACRCRPNTAAAAPTPSPTPGPWPALAAKAPASAPSSPATPPSASIRS